MASSVEKPGRELNKNSKSIFEDPETENSFDWVDSSELEKDEEVEEEDSFIQDSREFIETAVRKDWGLEEGNIRRASENIGRPEDYSGPISLSSIHHSASEIADKFTKWGIRENGRRIYTDSEFDIVALDYNIPSVKIDLSSIIDTDFRENIFDKAPYDDVRECVESTTEELYLSLMEELESEELPYLPVEERYHSHDLLPLRTQMIETEGYNRNINLLDKLFLEIEDYLRRNDFRNSVVDGFNQARKELEFAYKAARMENSDHSRPEFKIKPRHIPSSEDVQDALERYPTDRYDSFEYLVETAEDYSDYQDCISVESGITFVEKSPGTNTSSGQTASI